MPFTRNPDLPIGVLDILPNPVLVKDADLRYVWVNKAFEKLFNVSHASLVGRLDTDVFKDRQSVQCNGGDRRVLASGEVDEAYETVFRNGVEPRVTITRKSRLTVEDRSYLVGVMHDVTEVTEANKALEQHKAMLEEKSLKLQEMAYTDPLTGVMNRRRLAETAPVIFGTHRNTGVVLTSDLDHFKRINDTYGHDIGDAALIHFVEIAQSAMREGDMIARSGGEEFVILLPGTGTEDGFAIAERIRTCLEDTPLKAADTDIKMTVSIGMAYCDGREFDLNGLIKMADTSLYEAKDTGRNRVVVAA